jgi:hypothetical protein
MDEMCPIEVGDNAKLVIVTSDKKNRGRPIKAGRGAIVIVTDSEIVASLLLQAAEIAEQTTEAVGQRLSATTSP